MAVNKKTKLELDMLSRFEMAKHLEEITQTEICKDKKYCKTLLSVWLRK